MFPFVWELLFCNRLSVGRISLLHQTVRVKETRFRINYIILGVGDTEMRFPRLR